jgi:hypothetical protein
MRSTAVPSLRRTRLALRTWAADHDFEIEPDTNLPWWDGAVPDYDWAVSSLLGGS